MVINYHLSESVGCERFITPLCGLFSRPNHDSCLAFEFAAHLSQCSVEGYLQRRRHRPWRNRGS